MAEYNKKPQVFIKRGMNISLPGDRLGQEWFQYVRNVRSYITGEWRQRPGMQNLYTTPALEDVYYMSRINDATTGTFRRLVGTSAGNVYVDNAAHNALSLADSGYSANKYSSVISRPDRSPLPFTFIASDQRNGKFSTLGARTEWGLQAPTSPLVVEPQGINYALINDCNATAGFVASAGILTAVPSAGNAISAILYDSGTTGMASITGTSGLISGINGIRPGMIITLTTSGGIVETVIVQETFPGIFPPTSVGPGITIINSISYDSGTTGPCVIQLNTPNFGLQRNSLVRLNFGGAADETVRVLSVTSGPDGIPSFRCSTVNTHVAGESVNGSESFRCFTINAHNTASVYGFAFLTLSPPGTPQLVTLTRNGSLNLAVGTTNSGGTVASRPIQSDDFFHISVRGNYNVIDEIQIQFDLTALTDFLSNYYFISIRQPDLEAAYSQTATAIQAQQLQVQRQQLDEFVQSQNNPELDTGLQRTLGDLSSELQTLEQTFYGLPYTSDPDTGPVSSQFNAGDSWTDIFIPLSQFQRVGTEIKDWSNVTSFRVTINYTATTAIPFSMDDMWIGGTFGPNTHNIPGYTYTYRARNSSTGSVSNPAPLTRSPILSNHRRMAITIPSYPDPQADVIDIFRLGGLLQQFQLVGTVGSSVGTFQDDVLDISAIRNPFLEFDRFKPWVSADLPKSGTCDVVGTTVLRSTGDLFNTQWVRGTQILINGRVYTFYSKPSSTNRVEITESAGSLTNVVWQIPEPTLDSQTYATVFGPYAGSAGEFNFAVGDPRNPGFLYWTNGNDPESTSDVNFIELCSPSEKLMTGVILDGLGYVFSAKRSWRILPAFEGGQTGGASAFYPQETAMGKGTAFPHGVAVGDAIYFVSYDGIYRSRGDAVEDLTTESLAPLFKRDGTNTTFQAPVSPIDFNAIDEGYLTYSYDGLYFTYQGLDTLRYAFYMSFMTGGWVLDSITADSIILYSREVQSPAEDNVLVGTASGDVLTLNSGVFADDGVPISCRLWDREEIWDTLRATKQVGDTMIDANPDGATITPTMRYDNNTFNDVLTTLTGSGRTQYVRDINSGVGRIVRGAALDLTWTDGTLGTPRVYAWEPAALIKPEESVNRASDWDNGGYTGTKWLQGFRLRGDTEGLTKSFEVQQDGGTTVEAFNFIANGEQVQTFWLTNPVVAHEMRILGTDGDLWRNMGIEWIFEPEPEQAAVWETQVTSFDLPFFMHIREVMIAHRSTADITMSVITDGVTRSYTIPNSAGQRVRSYLPMQAVKAKYHKFRFTSAAPFGLWMADIECRVGAWGRTESYTIQRPFGDISRTNGGARI